ncbi:MAG: hypothetical protein IPN76_17625 [Saprospiraceae bacterium]|nr:hypothetical protein [Saprospiraceae bacterium]
MKLYLLAMLGLVAIVVLVACNRKTAVPAAADTAPITEEPKSGGSKPIEMPKEKAHQVVGFQKTACFGKCPAYQVKFYNDGKATWYGQFNVERMGWHEATVSKDVLTAIKQKVSEIRYLDFAQQYPTNNRVADLPSTVTYIRIGDIEKMVVNTYQAPAELEAFEEYLEGIINGLAWKRSQKD